MPLGAATPSAGKGVAARNAPTARRTSDRLRYQMGVERIIYPREWRDRDDPLLWITQEYTSAIERFVRQDPVQYLWIHRRWKTRPKK